MKKDITIVGAGLVGSLLSVYLSKRGYSISLFERRSDMRKEKLSAGRSINLALSDRGLLALEKVGLAYSIKQICIPMHGRCIHNTDGTIAFQPYGKEGQYINSVSRGELNKRLMSLAEENGANIYFNEKCTAIDWDNRKVVFENEETKNTKIQKADLIFGADGAFSAARLQHQLHHHKFDYQQYYIDCGYKELTIPPTANGDFALEPNALHIWPRKYYMLIALPNLDKTFTCTLFFPFENLSDDEQRLSFKKINTEEKIKKFFHANFPDAIPLMPDYVNEFLTNPTSSLVTVKCFPWIRDDYFALIGDAAHALVPFYGQGMNCGFEDCRILDELIEKYATDWSKVFSEYQTMRKPDADAIADLAIYNFTEMRDKTADPKFLLQKKIENRFAQLHPDKWLPLYSLVTFSPEIRYSDAMKKGEQQEKIMSEIMKMPGLEKKWESEEIEKLMLRKIK